MLGYQSLMLVSLLSVGIGGILVCSLNATALCGLFLGHLWFVLGSGVYSTPPLGRGTTRPPVPMATSLGAQSSGAPSGGGGRTTWWRVVDGLQRTPASYLTGILPKLWYTTALGILWRYTGRLNVGESSPPAVAVPSLPPPAWNNGAPASVLIIIVASIPFACVYLSVLTGAIPPASLLSTGALVLLTCAPQHLGPQ